MKSECVTFTPYHSLSARGFEFAMATQNFTLAADEEQCAIDGPLGLSVTFNDTDHNIDSGSFCRSTQLVSGWAGNFNGIL
jgi:hypothetical protein